MNAIQIQNSSDNFQKLSYLKGFEINRQGVVRSISTGLTVNPNRLRSQNWAPFISCSCSDGIRRASKLNALLYEAFGPGAAEKLGLPTPDWDRVQRSRQRAEQQRIKGGQWTSSVSAPRRCTTCKKPTSDYRCKKCWDTLLKGYKGFD